MEGSGLIQTQELAALISNSHPHFIVDGSLFPGADTKANFTKKHIPGAKFFDQMEIRDKSTVHPLAYPTLEAFRNHMMRLRLPNDGKVIVVYDQYGMVGAPRALFLLKFFGYQQVRFLDGGLPKWEAEGRPLVSGPPTDDSSPVNPAHYHFSKNLDRIIDFDHVKTLVNDLKSGTKSRLLWDPRSPAVVTGTSVPQTLNIFYKTLLNPDFTLKPKEEIRRILTEKGLDLSKPVVVTCNRGVTSSSGCLILQHIGKTDYVNYPGSWAEWSHRSSL